MENVEIAQVLNDYAALLEIQGESPFRARELGVKLVINSDAQSVEGLRLMRYSVDQARRGWLEPTNGVNTLPWAQFQQWLRRDR